MIVVLAWTGMRRGEVLALKWSDVTDGEIHIQRSVRDGVEKPTKTDDPRRVAAVGPLATALSDQRKWLLEVQHPGLDSGLAFPADPQQAEAGRVRREETDVRWYRSPSVMDDPIRRVVSAAGLPGISPHSFRRTYENLLRRSGVDDLVRRTLAGWRTESAQDIYASVSTDERAAAVTALARLVETKPPTPSCDTQAVDTTDGGC